MSRSKLRLPQLRARLRRAVHSGWQEVSCSTPRNDPHEQPDSQSLGPSQEGDAEQEFARLWSFLIEQAQQGRVKANLRLDEQRYLQIDARYGSLRSKKRSEESFEKMMGHKERSIRVDTHAPLLRSIGLLNADGSLSTRHARKYKQINHFVELCRPLFPNLLPKSAATTAAAPPFRVLDLGCGNSYLTFVLAQALRNENIAACLLGIDRQEALIARSQARAEALGFEEMHFCSLSIDESKASVQEILGGAPDLLVSLHACDVATDDALALGVQEQCASILSAPCCHAQWAATLKNKGQTLPFSSLQKQGLLRRAYAEVLTDAYRVEFLQAFGYEVSTLEFVTSDHSAKNLMIRAEKKRPVKLQTLAQVHAQGQELEICPVLLRCLAEAIDRLQGQPGSGEPEPHSSPAKEPTV